MTNDELTRRGLLAGAALVSGGALLGALAPAAQAQDEKQEPDMDRDRGFVMGAGMTAEEAEAWRLAGELAGAFFALPELHPMDKQEVATAIHVVQNKLLSRPTYRKYLENAKAGR
jgi:hypothetical protein